MPRQTRPPEGHFAERLDRLFRTVHPKDRGPYTPAEVAAAINAEADERVVSGTYLWLLRTGQRDNPTLKHLVAIARFFGVPPTYFFPDDVVQQDAVPAGLGITGLRRRLLGLRVRVDNRSEVALQ
jgi:transcriptional regulator with XRE-family HTH domain